MTIPLPFPDWIPGWLQLLLIVVGILLALCLAMMPFSVFGTKSRLEAIEARLDEIQGEIRLLALRLPETGRFPEPERDIRNRPPIPPVSWRADTGVRAREPKPRSEPRL